MIACRKEALENKKRGKTEVGGKKRRKGARLKNIEESKEIKKYNNKNRLRGFGG